MSVECKHFGSCGSCVLFDPPYQEQLEQKNIRLQALLAPFYQGDITPFASPTSHYRARAEFRIWHESDKIAYAIGNSTKDGSITLTQCPKVIEPIDGIMWKLLETLQNDPLLKTKLFGIEFLATSAGEVLVTLLYHKKLDEVWEKKASTLQKDFGIGIIGRSRKQKVVLDKEFVTQTIEVDDTPYRFRHYEQSFTQPNPYVNAKMIAWTKSKAANIGGDLLELYCGHGNFTIPLSEHFDKVLATEIASRSIKAAKENCELNSIEKITFVRLSAEETMQALKKQRTFRRLQGIDLDSFAFRCILVDPPRAGLGAHSIALASTMEHILYISCNPETLRRDLHILTQTHEVVDAALFDQFPYTRHIECGVFLKRK